MFNGISVKHIFLAKLGIYISGILSIQLKFSIISKQRAVVCTIGWQLETLFQL